jgi:DNA-binding IclR family transcriptional regulator
MIKKKKTDYTIRTVSRALDLLEQFHENIEELGVTELSKRLKLHKNNVFRLLATLESHRFIEQNRTTGNYRLGLKNLELGQTIIRQMGLVRHSRQELKHLTAHCNETSYVAILKDHHVIYLDVVESDLPVRVMSLVGVRLPAHCTAAGKVQLAAMADEELAACLSAREMKPFTAHTITDPDLLKRELRKVAEQGYAIDDEELYAGVRSVSAPIRDYTRMAIGSVSISGPVMRFSGDRMERELIPLAIKAAEEISARLGYHLDKAV